MVDQMGNSATATGDAARVPPYIAPRSLVPAAVLTPPADVYAQPGNPNGGRNPVLDAYPGGITVTDIMIGAYGTLPDGTNGEGAQVTFRTGTGATGTVIIPQNVWEGVAVAGGKATGAARARAVWSSSAGRTWTKIILDAARAADRVMTSGTWTTAPHS